MTASPIIRIMPNTLFSALDKIIEEQNIYYGRPARYGLEPERPDHPLEGVMGGNDGATEEGARPRRPESGSP